MRTKQSTWDNLLDDPLFKKKCDQWSEENLERGVGDVSIFPPMQPFFIATAPPHSNSDNDTSMNMDCCADTHVMPL